MHGKSVFLIIDIHHRLWPAATAPLFCCPDMEALVQPSRRDSEPSVSMLAEAGVFFPGSGGLSKMLLPSFGERGHGCDAPARNESGKGPHFRTGGERSGA